MLCPVYVFQALVTWFGPSVADELSQLGFSEIQCGGQPAQAFDELSVLCEVNVAFSNELRIWEMTSGSVFVFYPLFGSTADAVHASTHPLFSISVPVTRGVIPA